MRNQAAWALVVSLTMALGPQAKAGPFDVTPEAGPWMILVASFSGATGGELADEMANDIRQKYQLPAYVFNKGGEEKRKQQERLQKLRELCPDGRFRTTRIQEHWAVVVGGYAEMEVARKELDKIRQMKPPAEKFMDRAVLLNDAAQNQASTVVQTGYINPFQGAFVVRNPTAPIEPDPEKGKPDPFLKKLNADESFSLLKCRKHWTLVVKVYTGAVEVTDGKSDTTSRLAKIFGTPERNLLTASGMQAHSLAEVLRKMGYEAHVLHTRHQSIVTVGNYDTADDPKLQHNRKTLAGLRLVPVEQLMANPLPMEIPRP